MGEIDIDRLKVDADYWLESDPSDGEATHYEACYSDHECAWVRVDRRGKRHYFHSGGWTCAEGVGYDIGPVESMIPRPTKQEWTPERQAVKTLENMNYTYRGGEYWIPPLGKAPAYSQEWDGEAFPIPSGAKCEVQMGSFWYPGTVIASTAEAAWFKSDHGGDFWTIMNGLSIRPIRTKEQRQKDELIEIIGKQRPTISDLADAILSHYTLEPKQ